MSWAATHYQNVLRKPSCGNNLGPARPAGFAVSPYEITTYGFFKEKIKNHLRIDDNILTKGLTNETKLVTITSGTGWTMLFGVW